MPTRGNRGFSLVELLVVITIIGVLLAIGLVVGERVTTGAQRTATQGKLVILDQSLAAYQADNGGANPPAITRVVGPDDEGVDGPGDWRYMLLADAAGFREPEQYNTTLPTMVNSVGAYIEAANAYASVRAIISEATPPPEAFRYAESREPEVPTVFDSFRTSFRLDSDVAAGTIAEAIASRTNAAGNNPIRFVHPSFDGRITEREQRSVGNAGRAVPLVVNDRPAFPGTTLPPVHGGLVQSGFQNNLFNRIASLRRNFLTDEDRANWTAESLPIGDSDGGQCPGGQPYFYSPGPDGDPSTLDDNVYSITPTLPNTN